MSVSQAHGLEEGLGNVEPRAVKARNAVVPRA